ncbi:hypothetical protein G3480_19075 [Thiorhodococcus mannitoliphagus]|uniref:Uncharacterized protein n=1 Tax=Thiorhodococcus mannitoliphagus TaxID=329406 RepID=A0A6P1DZ93_9GAMM|nr:hypothetical protein [Thiorhodococcus mannitoliphagus]NEX22383.1 hypothetical protein [Thiorhodococcus mannitoliphagus]
MTAPGPSTSEPMPRFLDFEASSLASGSYPIEVAWSNPDGSIESYLISPASVERWTDWSWKAEQLHGIRRVQLLAEGKSPDWVCRRLNEALDGATVYTDDPDYDGQWLTELFSATWGLSPSFTLANAAPLFLRMLEQDAQFADGAARQLERVKDSVRQQLPQRHRASWDVEYLLGLWRQVNRPSSATPPA